MRKNILPIFILFTFGAVAQTVLAQLQWPLDQPYQVKGTYGDYRTNQFHGGIDIHKDASSPIKPVRSGLLHYVTIFNPGKGYDIFTKFQFPDASRAEYVFGHVNNVNPSGVNWEDYNYSDEPIDDHLVNGAFTNIWEWPQSYQHHLHLNVKDIYGNALDPLYADNSEDYRLDFNDSILPEVLDVAFLLYDSNGNATNSVFADAIPGLRDVDIVAYITDRNLNDTNDWDQKVGVDEIYWAITDNENQQPAWDFFVKFSSLLPPHSQATTIYAFTPFFSQQGNQIKTFQSGEANDHVDRMWYIVTNYKDGEYTHDGSWYTPDENTNKCVWIKAVDSRRNEQECYNGDGTFICCIPVSLKKSSVDSEREAPQTYNLMQNHPNPFDRKTSIRYRLPMPSHTVVNIYNSLGQHVVKLQDTQLEAGRYEIIWHGRDASGNLCANGIYFFRMNARSMDGAHEFSSSNKLILAR